MQRARRLARLDHLRQMILESGYRSAYYTEVFRRCDLGLPLEDGIVWSVEDLLQSIVQDGAAQWLEKKTKQRQLSQEMTRAQLQDAEAAANRAAEELLDLLGQEGTVKRSRKPAEPQVQECSICLEEMDVSKKKAKARKLKCGHYFHQECMSMWAKRDKTCPYCRKEL